MFNGTTDDGDNGAELYTRAFRVDDNGRSMLIELARSHGSCGTCTGSSESDSTPIVKQGFRAEIYGTVVALSSDSGNSGSGSDNSGNGSNNSGSGSNNSGSGSDTNRVPVLVQVTDAKRSNDQAIVCGVTKVTPGVAPTNVKSDKESEIAQQSNDTGITALSVIVVLMASALAVMSLYFVVVGSPNASKSSI
jgi:hypothetical protein